MDSLHPLKRYRDRHDMTLEDFARVVGTTKSVVSKWERGALPRKRFRDKILLATGGEVTTTHFVLGADMRQPAPKQTEGQAA